MVISDRKSLLSLMVRRKSLDYGFTFKLCEFFFPLKMFIDHFLHCVLLLLFLCQLELSFFNCVNSLRVCFKTRSVRVGQLADIQSCLGYSFIKHQCDAKFCVKLLPYFSSDSCKLSFCHS
jgi:hypothetical protein